MTEAARGAREDVKEVRERARDYVMGQRVEKGLRECFKDKEGVRGTVKRVW